MSEIPEDIRRTAAQAVAGIADGTVVADVRFLTGFAARAIMAERERCARIAECDCCDVCGESPGYPKCANEIAAAIRGGN